MELTPAGRLYADYCRDALRHREQFELELEALKAKVEGTVRVASIYSVGLTEMGRLEAEFSAGYPSADLKIEYMRPDRIYDAVGNDAADLGVVSYPQPSREIAVIAWRDEEMQLAVPPDHPLAVRAKVQLGDLNGQEFVGFDEDLPIRREIDRFLRAHTINVNPALHFDNIQMVKEAVALGRGVSILPARTMQAEIAQGRLAAVPLDAPELVRPVGVVHRRHRKLNRAAQAFLELLIGSD